jgi:hypothetical protein
MNTVFGYPAVAAYLVSSTSGGDRAGRFSDFAAATYRACTDSRRGPDCCGMVGHDGTLTHASNSRNHSDPPRTRSWSDTCTPRAVAGIRARCPWSRGQRECEGAIGL